MFSFVFQSTFMPFKTGPKFKFGNNPIINDLNLCGYSSNNIHVLLGCTKNYGYKLIQEPGRLTLTQLKAISWALNKPLGYVINKLLVTPVKSGNWLSEDYNPGVHVENLKGKAKEDSK